MTDWTERALADVAGRLGDHGVAVVGDPNGRPERLEALALAGVVAVCLREGFAPAGDRLDLERTNRIPYRRVTQGSGVGQQVDLGAVVDWAAPVFAVERDGVALSLYREGSPFLRSRERPDLLAYQGRIDVERASDPFVGDHAVVTWSGERSGERRYKRETDSGGPVPAERRGDPLVPVLGAEVSIEKSCERLREQVALLERLGSRQVAAVLEHANPCAEGSLPAATTVFTATDERSFDTTMDRIGEAVVERVADAR